MNKKESGIALIAAIFLVVVIGAALVILATLSVRNSQQTTQNLLQARASLAASAALEYAVQTIVETGSCPANPTVNVPSYTEFTVSLACIENDYNRPSQSITVFELTASSEYGSPDSADYVWTEQKATIEL
jgi:MSHA biogenesis protein MshP